MSEIQVRNISKAFGEKRILVDLSADFPIGRITCIMGESGCGKTTLLKILSGIHEKDEGTITGLPERIAYVFQEDRLSEDFSSVSNIRMVMGKSMPVAKIEEHLSELGLAESMYLPVRELSGGMKRRVSIARAICYNAPLLLLDEPFKGLDEASRSNTIAYVKKYSKDATVICATHDAAEVELLDAGLINMICVPG